MAERVERVYAWLMTDAEGNESVPAVAFPDGTVGPLIGTQRASLEIYRDIAREIQRHSGHPVRFVCFESRVDLERLSDA